MRAAALIGVATAPALHVMTFNVRRRLPLSIRRADRWTGRRRAVDALLPLEQPTVLGVQEAMPGQADAVADAVRTSAASAGRLLFGEFPIDFPLDLKIGPTAEKV